MDRLPIRLLPRRLAQIPLIIFFGFFLGFAIFWTMMAATTTGEAEFGDGQSTESWLSRLFPLFGVPFMLIGAGGIARAALKMLPGSPYYHLEISDEGLLVRSPFKHQRYAWRALPPFDTLERRRRTKNGVRIEWYAVALEPLPPKAGMEPGAAHRREVLRIFADEYGAKDGRQDAVDLAAWLNSLRELALDRRLAPNEEVEVPEGFRGNAISAMASAIGVPRARRAQTVVRR